jgi:CDP-diacylglycerol--serine O-phosphatidyltransferase
VRFISLVVVAGFIIVAVDPPIVLLAIFGGYAASAPIVWVWRRLRRLRRGDRTPPALKEPSA